MGQDHENRERDGAGSEKAGKSGKATQDSRAPDETLRDLAEKEIAEKQAEVGDADQARELYDVPSISAAELALDQESDKGD